MPHALRVTGLLPLMVRRIIHFHVAKTGGTSLNRWLDTLVPACRARPAEIGQEFHQRCLSVDEHASLLLADRTRFHPLHRADFGWSTTHAHRETEATPLNLARAFVRAHEFGREARAYWDVVHDHSPALPIVDRSAYRLVVLREPEQRLLSFLRDWRRLSIDELAVLPPRAQLLRRAAITGDADAFLRCAVDTNLLASLTQTVLLMAVALHVLPHDRLATCDPSPLALAGEALDSCFDLVGVAERMDDVVRCIARDCGVCPVESLGRANQGAVVPGRDTLSAESRAILREAFADDFALYEKAQAMFQASIAPAYDEADFEAHHLERRLQELTPRLHDGRLVFSLDDRIVGQGFHGRDAPGTDGVTVWTGPGTRTALYLPVPAGERLELHVDVGGYVHPSVGDSLRVRVDGRECPLMRHVAPGLQERIVVPVVTTRPWCRLELLVDRTFTPAAAGHDDGDGRRLGVALRGYGYRLAPTAGVVWRTARLPAAESPCSGGVPPMAIDPPHADAPWAHQVATEWMQTVASETEPERLVDLMAWGLSADALQANPTAAAVDRAYRRFHLRPAPQDWLDFWVGRDDVTVRDLYRDLVRGAEFQRRLERLRAPQ